MCGQRRIGKDHTPDRVRVPGISQPGKGVEMYEINKCKCGHNEEDHRKALVGERSCTSCLCPDYDRQLGKTSQELDDCKERHRELCAQQGLPNFAPTRGICYRCHRNIYQPYPIKSGQISEGETGEEYITGCPHCHHSFCE